MLKVLTPNLYLRGLAEVPLKKLVEDGFKGLIIDLDNTVTEWNVREVNPEIAEWFKTLRDFDMRVCLLSNNGEGRVLAVAEKIDIPYVFNAGKPRQRAFHKAIKVLGTKPEETVVIGDQIFTDVLGANRAKLFSILVVPLSRREFVGTRFMRRLERVVLRRLAGRGVVIR